MTVAALAACGGGDERMARSTSTSRAAVTTSTVPTGTPGSITLHLSTPFILSGTGSTAVTCSSADGRRSVAIPETETAAGVRVAAEIAHGSSGTAGSGRVTVTLPSGITYPIEVTGAVTTNPTGGTVVFDTTVQGARVQGDLQWGCSR